MMMEPVKPDASDCCGQGCRRCVFDVYEEELKIWRKQTTPTDPVDYNNSMSPEHYMQCEIVKVIAQCDDVSIYQFKLPDKSLLHFTAGQHLMARELTDNGAVCRPYTIVSRPGNVAKFSILIKTYAEGVMSQLIATKWTEGYRVWWRGPFGECDYQANSRRNVILIAAGTGIAPVYQIAKQIVANEEEETFVKLIYCCKSYESILLREKLNRLTTFWNFKSRYVLSHQEGQVERIKKHDENVHCGQLNEDLLRKELVGLSRLADSRIFVCGSQTFETDIGNYLKRLNLENIVTF